MTTLTAENVARVFLDCLFRKDEVPSDPAFAEGIRADFGFHRGRLEEHRAEIKEMLECLPVEFQANGGGGWTFLNAAVTRDGEHWGEHANVEQLLVLGIASGEASYAFPRQMWAALPGGLPFFTVGNCVPE